MRDVVHLDGEQWAAELTDHTTVPSHLVKGPDTRHHGETGAELCYMIVFSHLYRTNSFPQAITSLKKI